MRRQHSFCIILVMNYLCIYNCHVPCVPTFRGKDKKQKNRNEFLQNRNGFARLKLMSISPHVRRGKHRLWCKRDISPRGQNMRSAGTTWPGKQKLRTLLECGAGRLYAITIVWLQNRSHSLNVWRKQWRSHGHHRLRQVLCPLAKVISRLAYGTRLRAAGLNRAGRPVGVCYIFK